MKFKSVYLHFQINGACFIHEWNGAGFEKQEEEEAEEEEEEEGEKEKEEKYDFQWMWVSSMAIHRVVRQIWNASRSPSHPFKAFFSLSQIGYTYFLDASTQEALSVGPSVGPSVRPTDWCKFK